MSYNNAGGQQRGPLSDQRTGKGRAETMARRQGAGFLTQVFWVAVVLAGVAALYVVAAFLWSEDPGLRIIAWAVIGLLVAVVAGLQILRRRRRQSLDDVLRSRRTVD
jgi:hypothetical protein